MAAHKHIDRICLAAALFSLLVSLLFLNGQALGLQPAERVMGYESRLFDTSRVHTIDIVMDDWDSFLDTCENEEYAACAVVIDGEAYKNVGLRAKGNTSLSTVSQLGSDRYSFKIEFDHYESGKTYHGLDKLSLNNIIQDNTCMKDYLTYRLMAQFGANAPLCSYGYITVNGQEWGLYLAIEGLEDGFLQRSYGQDHGALYKPDSMSFGGGRGNGREFDFGEFDFSGFNFDDAGLSGRAPGESGAEDFNPGGFGGMGGMDSSDTKLQYIDDDPDSYSNIFDSAKTEITEADKTRLIQSLKALSAGGDVSGVVDMDQVLRYFVVHNFVVNGDSYTGSMVHNYYLYEEDGRLSMLPWDYNLAFGTFQSGSASGAVNDPIDSPLSVTGDGSRPMADWIFASQEYTDLYHQYFAEFLDTVDPSAIIEETRALIAPYVEKDPTGFCTYEEFETGVEALDTFCALRVQSVSGQLAGTIPSTSAGQAADGSALVDASALTLSDMGTMNSGGRFGGDGERQAAFAPAMGAEPDRGEMPAFPGGGERQPTGDGTGPAQPDGGEAPSDAPDSGEDEAPPAASGGDAQPPQAGSFPESGGTQSSGQRPEGVRAGNFGGFPGDGAGNQLPGGEAPQTGTSLILLGVSALVLLAGLAIAFKFRR